MYIAGEDYNIENELSLRGNTPYYNYLQIEKIKSMDNLSEVLIQLDGKKFYPNGNFIFDFQPNTRAGRLNSFLEFKKGDYQCTSNCFFNYHDRLGFMDKGDSIAVYLKEKKDSSDSIGYNWFFLNMINQKKVYEKQLYYAMAVSFYVAGLILIIEFIVTSLDLFLFRKKRKTETLKKEL